MRDEEMMEQLEKNSTDMVDAEEGHGDKNDKKRTTTPRIILERFLKRKEEEV